MKTQAKVLQALSLLRHVPHVANNGAYYNQNKFTIEGLHPRLWVKAGLVWVPGSQGGRPPGVAYGWMQYLQKCYSADGDEEKDAARSWPVDPPLWGTAAAPLALWDTAVTTADGTQAATVATTIGNGPTIPAVTRYVPAKIGHVQEFQTAASAIEVGVVALAATGGTDGLGGQWRGFASCYPAGPMSECEWNEVSRRFRYGIAPSVVDLEATAD